MTPTALDALRQLTRLLTVSVAAGDLLLLHNVWYITHAGLLRIAQRRHCFGIETFLNEHLSDPSSSRWVFKAVVFKNASCKGFTGYGDADPSNMSLQLYTAPKCELPRHEPSTGHSEKLTVSVFAVSKNSDRSPLLKNPSRSPTFKSFRVEWVKQRPTSIA